MLAVMDSESSSVSASEDGKDDPGFADDPWWKDAVDETPLAQGGGEARRLSWSSGVPVSLFGSSTGLYELSALSSRPDDAVLET